MDSIKSIKDIKNLSADELFDLVDEMDHKDNQTQNQPKSKSSIKEYLQSGCPECGSKQHIAEDFSQGIVECKNCGQVIENIIDYNPEWTNYEDGGEMSRCSIATNPLMPQASLGTSIASTGYRRNMIQTLHSWGSMPYRERMLYIVLKDIQSRCRENNIMKCIEDDAKIMFKMVSECKHPSGENKGKFIIIRGSNRKSLIAACVFFACRKKNLTRSPHEIAKIFNLKYTDITKGFKNFLRLIRLRKVQIEFDCSAPEHFVARYCKIMHLKKPMIDNAVMISQNVNKLNIASDHTPPSVATASLLLMIELNGLSITKRSIANKFKVSEVTITKVHRKIKKYINLLLNQEAVDGIVEKMRQVRSDSVKDIVIIDEQKIEELHQIDEVMDKIQDDESFNFNNIDLDGFDHNDEGDNHREYQEKDEEIGVQNDYIMDLYQQVMSRYGKIKLMEGSLQKIE
jgi:transcription initiation factor TFIIIB Brf1 subunit/transcription initiation factor TFIIB